MNNRNIVLIFIIFCLFSIVNSVEAAIDVFSQYLDRYSVEKDTTTKYHYGYKKGIEVKITPDIPEVPAGSIATFTISLKNISKYPLSIDYQTGQHWDLIIYQGKSIIYRWSDNYEWKKAPHSISLNPGEVISEKLSWESITAYNKPFPQGTYKCVGLVTCLPKTIITSEERFRLIPPSDVKKEIIKTRLNQCFDIELPRFADGSELKWVVKYVYNDNRIDATSRKLNPDSITITFMPKRLGYVEFYLYAYTKEFNKSLERRSYRIEVE